jgi:intracellular sulfur oxidation DsrE/DsrF family protein
MNMEKPTADTVILVTNDGMGNAEKPLRVKLFGSYLRLLQDIEPLPTAICFYADGVKMVVEGSPVLDELKTLEEKGVLLILCGTCLRYFQLTEKIVVGFQGGMPDIIEAQWKADKLIRI